MSDGTETTTTAPAPAAAAPVEAKPLLLADPVSLFEALAADHIEGKPGDPRDKNPKIRFGITRRMLGDFLNRKGEATAVELAALTEETAREILYRRYWLPMGMDKLPEPVASALFKVAVRKGVEDAGKLLQKGITTATDVALKIDGRVGTETHKAIDHLVSEGKGVALAREIIAHQTTFAFRLFDGKLFGRDVDFAATAVLVGKAAVKARLGIAL